MRFPSLSLFKSLSLFLLCLVLFRVLDELIVEPSPLDHLHLLHLVNLFTLNLFLRDLSQPRQRAFPMPLVEPELTLIHVSIIVNTDASPMAQVLKPFSIVLPVACDFLTMAIPHAVEPAAFVYVVVTGSL